MKIEGNIITADEGKVFQRKNTEQVYGNEIFLGYSYYINGVKQDPPHLDTSDDFEEIDAPQEEVIEEEVVEQTEEVTEP